MKACVVVTMLLGLACLLAGESREELRIHVIVANDSTSPVQITGLQTDSHPNNGPTVVLKNVSNKTINSIELAVAQAVPNGCMSPDLAAETDSPPVLGYVGFHPEQISLAPTEQVISGEQHLGPGLLAWHALDANARFMQAQIGVVEVQFADGTSWSHSPQRDIVFSRTLLQADEPSCADLRAQAASLEHIKRVRLKSQFGSHESDPAALGYSFTCTVSENDLLCPEWNVHK